MRKTLIIPALIAAAFSLWLPSCGGSSGDDLELLTILGDVANDPDDLQGRWRPARPDDSMPTPDTDAERQLDELTALPYVQGSTAAPGVENVTVYDPDRTSNGLNVYTSGHEPAAFVMDMTGRVVHKWQYAVEDVWPDVPRTMHSAFWRRAHAFPNGDVLAIFEGIGLLKLDRDSNLLWSFHGGCHHEAFVMDDGRIYVLTRQARVEPRINDSKPILTDAITVLSSDGEKLFEYPLLDMLESSKYASIIKGMRPWGDLFHTNSLQVFDGGLAKESPLFSAGNVMISMLKQNAVVIVKPETGEVVWAEQGGWERQHDPRLQPDGTIMLFDNMGRPGGGSRVLRYSPARKQIVWQYHGQDGDLSSKTCGVARRLPNGNILITESDSGRAQEITEDKDLVWEFYNPHRAGEDDELIATLFEVTRVDADYFPWLAH
jgi:hypothetical protein